MRSVAILVALLAPAVAVAEELDDAAAIQRASIDPAFRKQLLKEPKKTLAASGSVRVVEEPAHGRVLVLPAFTGKKVDPPANASAADRFMLELTWNARLRRKLLANWKLALREAKLPVPADGTLKVIDARPNERVVVLPQPLVVPEMFVHATTSVMRAITGGDTDRCPVTGCPGDGGGGGGGGGPPKAYKTTILRIDHKRWNQNPLGPGCKNDDRVDFVVPAGATLDSITMGEFGCDTSGPDYNPGTYLDTHVALGIVAGGTVLNSRPANGATGAQTLSYHWWFNQWGHSQAFICINVKSKKPLTLDASKTARFTHVNMDAGWVQHRVKLPVCFREFDVAIDLQGPLDGRPVSYQDIHVGAQVVASDHCVIEWFGCRDEHNQIP